MKSIDGNTLKQIFISASNNLYNHYHEVDALNVFPVPDGDTGMNMNLTLTSGLNEIKDKMGISAYEYSRIFARGLLMGARGNSGVITSQIFKGFSLALEGCEAIDAMDFARALRSGSDTAYKTVLKPVEGTILTVIRETSEGVNSVAYPGMSMEKLFSHLITFAKRSLKRTPELLPILKEVGVVDSGGAGLVAIFEGMKAVIDGQPVIRNEAEMGGKEALSAAAKALGNEEFGYCTEFIMSLGPDSVKKEFNRETFTATIAKKGNSLAVVHDDDIVKVHVHTMTPGQVLTYAQQFGEFLKLKIENMTEQHHALESGASPVDLMKDTLQLVDDEPTDNIPLADYAIVAVSSGDGIDELFKELGVNVIVKGGQTMNPSSEDFVSAIKKAHAKNIFILPNNSNILMAASQACEFFENQDINAYVIPSKTIVQGIVAAINFNPEGTPSINFRHMKSALKTIKSGEVTFSIRDCAINGLKIHRNDFIGIFEKTIVVSTKDKTKALLELLSKMIVTESSLVTVLYGKDIKTKEADAIKKELENKYPEINFDVRFGGQTVYSFIVGVE